MNRQSIPGIAGFFATPTPQGTYYGNASLGFSLYYPTDWIFEEQGGDSVVFASSRDVLDAADMPATGAIMGFISSDTASMNLPAGVDPTSPESILTAFSQSAFSGTVQTVEAVHSFSLANHPAASTVVSIDMGSGTPWDAYLTVVLSNNRVVVALGATANGNLPQYRATFDQMLSTFALSE